MHPCPALALLLTMSSAPTSPVAAEEYRVISALLEQAPIPGKPHAAWVLSATTTTGSEEISRGDITANAPSVSSEVLDDFFRKNTGSTKLSAALFRRSVTLLNTKDRDEIMGEEYPWDRFFARHPNTPGLMDVSRVGFDSAKKNALVYLSLRRGAKDAYGSVFLMTNSKTGWKVVAEVRIWEEP